MGNIFDIFKAPGFKWRRAPWGKDESLMSCEGCGNFHFIAIIGEVGSAKLRCTSCYKDVASMEMISVPVEPSGPSITH
jgi:hypothetical protein